MARLRVLGTRALPRLAAFIQSSESSTSRALALAALEGIEDHRAAKIALGALDSSDVEAVVAALSVLRGWVTQETGTRLLEAIATIAVDRRRDARIRFAATEALSDLPVLGLPIRAVVGTGRALIHEVGDREPGDRHVLMSPREGVGLGQAFGR